MVVRGWETVKVRYCKTADCNVALQVELLYPNDVLPDGARINGERCSHGNDCLRMDAGRCKWSGQNPDFDPFLAEEELDKPA
ncbi:MAG TPA: hypothetical protein VN376_04440 [Longilinea sp.]|nr:hypothetical protein [Longilinea sp.]